MQGVDPIGRIIQNLFTLQRIGNTIDTDGRVILDALHSQIAADIALINPAAPALQKWRLYRTDQLIDKVGERVGAAFPDWEKVLRNRLASAGRSQGQWASATLISSLGTTAGSGIIRKTPITQNWAKHILRTFPFGGAGGQHVLADWSSGLKDLTRNRIVKQLRLGMTLEESIPEMVRRIRGSQAGYMKNALGKTVPRFVGGVWKASTRDAESIVRTATTYVMSKAHLETFKANAHALLGIQFSAALDDRTTVICIGLDGSIWVVNSPDIVVPGEMTHFKCRSCLVPVPDYEKFGLAPPPDGFRKARDFSGLKPADLRRRMSTRRGKKLLGKQTTVSSKVTAEDWLRDQPQFVQAKMLGKERARLFREGKISIKEMVRSDKSLIPTRQLPGAYPKVPPQVVRGAPLDLGRAAPIGPWNPGAAKNPAALTREGLLVGIPDEEIVIAIRQNFPDYKAWKIAVKTYRKELTKKGLLPLRPVWDPTTAINPADLTRKGLLAGVPDEQIVAALREYFPNYKAHKIAVRTYRRELQRKGLLGTGEIPSTPVKPSPKKAPPGVTIRPGSAEEAIGRYRALTKELDDELSSLRKDAKIRTQKMNRKWILYSSRRRDPALWAEYETLSDAAEVSYKRIKELERQLERVRRSSDIFWQAPSQQNTFVGQWASGVDMVDMVTKERIQTGFDAFRRMVNKRWLPDRTVNIFKSPAEGGRPFHRGGNIFFGEGVDPKMVLHELGHAIEFRHPSIHKALRKFWEKRTKGLAWEDLGGSMKGEMTKPDKFFDTYAGKVYFRGKGPNTELLSMGLEAMFDDPMAFWLADPEHFTIIWEIMNGRIPKIP